MSVTYMMTDLSVKKINTDFYKITIQDKHEF